MPRDAWSNRWKQRVDRQIADVIGDGDVSHLPGAGEKLDLDADSGAPAEWRTAFKIMRDHDVMPEWIAVGKESETREADLRRQIDERARRYRRDKHGADARRAARGDASWQRCIEAWRERIERFNRDVLLHNLKLPAGIRRRRTLDAEALIRRAAREVDA